MPRSRLRAKLVDAGGGRFAPLALEGAYPSVGVILSLALSSHQSLFLCVFHPAGILRPYLGFSASRLGGTSLSRCRSQIEAKTAKRALENMEGHEKHTLRNRPWFCRSITDARITEAYARGGAWRFPGANGWDSHDPLERPAGIREAHSPAHDHRELLARMPGTPAGSGGTRPPLSFTLIINERRCCSSCS